MLECSQKDALSTFQATNRFYGSNCQVSMLLWPQIHAGSFVSIQRTRFGDVHCASKFDDFRKWTNQKRRIPRYRIVCLRQAKFFSVDTVILIKEI